MAFGMFSGLQPSEEERKKRREQFEGNKAKLGFGANAPQSSLLGAGKLGQQAQLGVRSIKAHTPAQVSPQIATNLASKQREQNLAQQQQTQVQQRATREAGVQDAKQAAQDIIKMPVKQQAQAVEQLKAQAPAPQRSSYQPSKAGDVALGVAQASTYAPQAMFAGTNALTGGKLSDLAKSGGFHPQNFRDNLERLKTPIEDKTSYSNNPQTRQNNAEQLKSMGIDASNPYVTGKPKTEESNNYPKVLAGRQSEPVAQNTSEAQPFITESYSDPTAPKLGFNPSVGNGSANKSRSQSSQGNIGFNIPRTPTRSWGERQQHEALLRDVSTAYKGAQNGQLTATQLELKAGIIGNDDKYKNDRYQSQMDAASDIAKARINEDGANSRAELDESGANNRFNSQLGFDVSKFQQTAELQQDLVARDDRRLDMQQANEDVKNFKLKQLNSLYGKYQTAETDDQKSAIAAQIADLNGTAQEQKDSWTNIGGGERLSDDGLTSTKNPDILLNKSTGETKEIPKVPVDFMRDPRALAILRNRDLSDEEMHAQLMALE